MVCNFAIVLLIGAIGPNDWAALWVYASLGGFLAQGGLLSAIAVFLRAGFWLRMGAFCAALLLSWISWALGLAFNSYAQGYSSIRNQYDELALTAFGLPLLAVAIQAPLWCLRLYRGWELLPPSQQAKPAQPLKILDYLVGTGLVAAAIASARLAVEPAQIDSEYWAGFGIACAVAAGISLISVPPALWLLLRWRIAWLGWAALVVYAASTTAVILAIIEYANRTIRQRSSGLGLWEAVGMVTVFACYAAILGAGLWLLRATGFLLTTRRRPALSPLRSSPT